MTVLKRVTDLACDLLAIIWPTECVACGAPDRDCCPPCRQSLRTPRPVRRVPLSFPCYAADVYEGVPRALLIACKHQGRAGFAKDLGLMLAVALRVAFAEAGTDNEMILVAAASRPQRVRERGYRHVELILSQALKACDVKASQLRALRASPGRTGQVGLGSFARLRNARRVAVRWSAQRVIRGRQLVLVDDIVTTGATLTAAAEALESAGAQVVCAVVVCEAVRRDQAPLQQNTSVQPVMWPQQLKKQ